VSVGPPVARPLRPSALPKLAACPKWESSSDESEAAGRGQRMDDAFRLRIQGVTVNLPEDEHEAVSWAVKAAKGLSCGHPLEARESHLGIKVDGMTGTADLLCVSGRWSADLKSGQVRNYREQQAAYALGFMEAHFEEEWTVYLLFCDAREIVTLRFTLEEATEIVRGVVAGVHDPLATATPCEYCAWCAKKWSCPARLETVAWFLGMDPREVNLRKAIGDPLRLGQALDLLHAAADVYEDLRKEGAASLAKGITVPGWRLQAGRETKTVEASALLPAVSMAPDLALDSLGNLSASKAMEIWGRCSEAPFPMESVHTNRGAAFIVKTRKKPITNPTNQSNAH